MADLLRREEEARIQYEDVIKEKKSKLDQEYVINLEAKYDALLKEKK